LFQIFQISVAAIKKSEGLKLIIFSKSIFVIVLTNKQRDNIIFELANGVIVSSENRYTATVMKAPLIDHMNRILI
jgi:hypothetical protein